MEINQWIDFYGIAEGENILFKALHSWGLNAISEKGTRAGYHTLGFVLWDFPVTQLSLLQSDPATACTWTDERQ